MERFTMPAGLADEVCSNLGVAIPAERRDIEALYRAWCAGFPFDPVAKATAIAENRPMPGDDPVEVAERWLGTGLGSTCWGQVAVLGAILEKAGVRVTVGLDRMLTDAIVDFHAFVVADVDGEQLALDPIHPSGRPLPLRGGEVGTNPTYAVGFDSVDGRLEHWYAQPDGFGHQGRYAVLSTDLDPADARAFLAVSAVHSGVGRRFFVRRCPPDRFLLARPTPDGTALRIAAWADGNETIEDVADLDAGLATFGYTERALEVLIRSGLLVVDPVVRWAT